MIYVSHRLDEVFEIADRIAVLRDGALVGERRVKDTTPEELVSLIVGKALDKFEATPRPKSTENRVVAHALTVEGAGPVDFSRRVDQRSSVSSDCAARGRNASDALFLAQFHMAGEILLDGVAPGLTEAAAAMKAGVGLIARDRIEESAASGLTIRENTFINPGAIGPQLCLAAVAAKGGR